MRQNAARLWAWGKRHLLKALVAALAVFLLAFLAVILIAEPSWLQILEYLGIAMGGVLLAIGATIANRRAVAMENAARAQTAAAKAQAEAAMQQAKANEGAEAGRRQERLKTAIEHLGHASDSVRLGGAYELFHLVKEKDSEDLRWTALDILCAHIRRTTGQEGYRKKHAAKPSEEVQSLLTLLFVQEHEVFKGCHIDLQGSWLNGANLQVARLQDADLSGAHLQGARLQEADLLEAHLQGAHLQGAELVEAHLRGAHLFETHLQRANLSGAYLQGVGLVEVRLQGANLFGAHLQGARLDEAHLQGARLDGAQLQGTSLFGAQLQGTNLFGAQLQGAHLSEAHLQGAELSETHLQGTHLSDAQLQGASSHPAGYGQSFETRINGRIGRESDLSGAIFAGGLSRDYVASLVEGSTDIAVKMLHRMLEQHIGEPANHELPEGCGAITGSYTAEEAERWIAEYEKAMGVASKAGEE